MLQRICGFVLVLLFLLGPDTTASWANDSPISEIGRLYLTTYEAEDYGGYGQNWGMVEDGRGFLYVANVAGILEFDGVSWRQIFTPERGTVRSLARDATGRVFVGGIGELGYLDTDGAGDPEYVSLLDALPAGVEGLSDVWRTVARSEGVYFQTNDWILRWDGASMVSWPATSSFRRLAAIGDALYVQQTGLGLFELRLDQLIPAPGSVSFVDTKMYGLVPDGDDGFLVITKQQGMFRCSKSSSPETPCVPFAPQLTQRLTELHPYHGTRLADGSLIIGTIRGGLLQIDGSGRLLRTIDVESGLPDNSVWFTYVDRQGGVWLALNNGLARIEALSPLTYFELPSTANDITRHRGKLYVATVLGVLSFREMDGTVGLKPIPDTPLGCWSLLSTESGLLAGCQNGVYNLDTGRHIWAHDDIAFKLYRSVKEPEWILMGLEDGLARLTLEDGSWQDAGRLEGLDVRTRSVAEDDNGRIWMASILGSHVAVLDSLAGEDPPSTRYGPEHGLPSTELSVYRILDRMVVAARSVGLLTLRSQDPSRFVPFEELASKLPSVLQSSVRFHEDGERLWLFTGGVAGTLRPKGPDDYDFSFTALRRAGIPVFASYSDPEALWVGGQDEVVRLDLSGGVAHEMEFSVTVRRVTSSTDEVLYAGQLSVGAEDPSWPHVHNALRFAFAAPRFDEPQRTLYRTRLDGLEDNWSDWSTEPYKDYTNLWEGSYSFRVQAQDVYGVLSEEEVFAFRIQPPWFRSWWAYLIYLLALAGCVFAYIRSHRRQLEEGRQVIARLREVDKLKDEFLANTSHELRTPLYGITGLAESLIDGAAGQLPPEAKKNLSMVVSSGRRLSRLVDDILDFSKLRHHQLELQRESVDVHAVVEVVLALSTPLVGGKAVQLKNTLQDLPPVWADTHRLQQIFYNLIGNAIKFTEAGSVVVSGEVEGNAVVVHVQDTGMGIAEEQQGRIFDPFEQADASIERVHGGTGLGLAVTRSLVDLHGGTMSLRSSAGEGSTFSFSLPIAPDNADSEVQHPAVSSTLLAVGHDDSAPAEAIEPLQVQRARREGVPRILAVDDEPINLQILQNYLAFEDYDLVTVSSGEEALRQLTDGAFDLVLLDVMMPKLSGFEVCGILRRRYSREKLPVIFLTAKDQDRDVVTGLAAGANDYLRKPIAKDELLARLRPHLEMVAFNFKLEDLVQEKMEQIKVLEGILPICFQCKKIRDEEERWTQMERYIDDHSEAQFSHSLCPECATELMNGVT